MAFFWDKIWYSQPWYPKLSQILALLSTWYGYWSDSTVYGNKGSFSRGAPPLKKNTRASNRIKSSVFSLHMTRNWLLDESWADVMAFSVFTAEMCSILYMKYPFKVPERGVGGYRLLYYSPLIFCSLRFNHYISWKEEKWKRLVCIFPQRNLFSFYVREGSFGIS